MPKSAHEHVMHSNSLGDVAEIVAQVSAQVERGEAVDWEQLTRHYPEHAAELSELRPAIEGLLALNSLSGPRAASLLPRAESESASPRTLGDFELIREIGRGGMGLVFEARQLSLDRRVALKILPFAALANQSQLQRFKNEARAAASLIHPHIVPVFAVGVDRGIHYYAMQFIEGPTLADVLAALQQDCAIEPSGDRIPNDLTTRFHTRRATTDASRAAEPGRASPSAETGWDLQAELSTQRTNSKPAYFRTVATWGVQLAEALAYAHESGVVHRDIKPANLLLDGAGKPWITDFGLARLENDASLTMTGDIVGTLRYMAPEQALAKRVGIDHRADVYSLGVTLYELLVLRPAFEENDRENLLKQIAFDEPRPLTKVDPAIPGELQTIVLKAIRKNPDDRYAGAQELADDLQRFLDNRPIVARPPSLPERIRKWAYRHQALVTSVIILLLLATIGSGVGTLLVLGANAQTEIALKASRENEQKAAEQQAAAERRARENAAVVNFLVNDLLAAASPERAQGQSLTVKQVLASAEANIGRAFEGDTLVEASIRQAMGDVYLALGDLERAEKHVDRALTIRRDQLGRENRDTLQSMYSRAQVLGRLGHSDAFRQQLDEVLALQRHVLGPDDPDTLKSIGESVWLLDVNKEFETAVNLLDEVHKAQMRILGPDDRDTLLTVAAQANLLWRNGKLEAAERLHEETLRAQRKSLGPLHPDTVRTLNNYAVVLAQLGKYAQARELFEEGLAASHKVMGSSHQETLRLAENLVWDLKTQGAYQDAQQQLEEAVSISQRLRGSQHPDTAGILRDLAELLFLQGKYEEAVQLLESIIPVYADAYGYDHPRTVGAVLQLTWNLSLQDNSEDVQRRYRTAQSWLEEAWDQPDADRATLLSTMQELACLTPIKANWTDRVDYLQWIGERSQEWLGPTHEQTRHTRIAAMDLRARLGILPSSAADWKPLIEDAMASSDDPILGNLLMHRGDDARRQAQDAEALRAYSAAAALYARLDDDKQREIGVNVNRERSAAVTLCSPNYDQLTYARALSELRMLSRPSNPAYLLALAAGQYRVGDFEAAVATLQQSLAARFGGIEIGRFQQGERQYGVTAPGSFGFAWHRVTLDVHADAETRGVPQIRWRIDGRDIGVSDAGVGDGRNANGRVTLGYNDSFASVAADPRLSFGLIDNLVVEGEVDYQDGFDADSSSAYTVVRTSSDTRVTFAFDYRELGIPAAPHSRDGTTFGLKLEANSTEPPGAEAITLHTKQSFTGDYTVQFDAWLNFGGPAPFGGVGSTEFLTAGVGGDGLTVNQCGNNQSGVSGSGIWMAVNGDGGSYTRDYRMFTGPLEIGENLCFFSRPIDGLIRIRESFGFGHVDALEPYFAGYGLPSFEWFFLAMANWRLDRPETAREAYTRAVEIMDYYTDAATRSSSRDGYSHRVALASAPGEDLNRLRREAEALLGIVGEPAQDVTGF